MATTHGLNIYNASLELIYSSADVTWNQVDYFEVAAQPGSSVVRYYEAIIEKEVLVLQVFVNGPPITGQLISHTITYNNKTYYDYALGLASGTVKVTGGSDSAFILVLMR